MTGRPDVTDDLYRTAWAIAREVAAKSGRGHDGHLVEDMADTLFLAGWQVWRDEGDVGLAKHRMRSRRINLFEDLRHERKAPRPVSQLSEQAQRGAVRAMGMAPESYSTPDNVALTRELLQRMPDQRRKIAQLRMAALTNEEIARELGISKRMVEREITALRKELQP